MTKILVFESEPAFAWELRTELGRLGCTVQIVDDGNAGLQIAASDRPDLILLSIELPRMNGFSVCNKLKKDPQLKDVPLIIMSSDSSEETFEQHRRLKTRAEDYVRKPIALGELVGHIRQLIPIAAAIEPEAILIDEPVLFDDEVEDLAAPPPADASGQTAKKAEADSEIDDFLGGAFNRLISDDEPKAVPSVNPRAGSLHPDPPTIPAPPPPPPAAPKVVVSAVPLPPPPSARPRPNEPAAPARTPSVPPPRSVVSKGPVTARSAPPPGLLPSDAHVSSSDAAIIEQLRIELARTKEELARNNEETTRLGLALNASRSNVQLLEAREDNEEVIRLKHDVEELKAKLAVANANPPQRVGASREFLELRESLSKKDSELVVLRDQLTHKDNDLAELRNALQTLEADKSELETRFEELHRTCDEVWDKLDELADDHDFVSMRAENFESLSTKLEAKLVAAFEDAAAKISAVETLANARISEIETTLAQEKKAKEEALAQLAEEKAQSKAERERLIAEHTAFVSALVDKHTAELRALEEAHAEEVDAAHETEIANIRDEHAREVDQLVAKHALDLDAVRHDNQRALDALKAEHAAEVGVLTKSAEDRLAARNREFADEWVRGAAQLEEMHSDSLKKAEHDAAERVRAELVDHYENKLRSLEGKHATEAERLRSERDRAIEDLEAASRSAVQELDRHVIGLGADLQDTRIKLEETEEQRAALSAEVVRLKGERASHVAQVERLENEMRALNSAITALGAEKDRFVADAVASASRLARMRARWEQDRLSLEHTREALLQAASRLHEIESHPLEGE